jgi:hypothetical protein
MLRLVCDEHVHSGILRGLRRRVSDLDIVRVQDVGLAHTPDAQILEWAAREGRIIITCDVNTMIGSAWDRVKAGESMPGVPALREKYVLGQAIADIHLVAECYTEEEMRDWGVVYIPL